MRAHEGPLLAGLLPHVFLGLPGTVLPRGLPFPGFHFFLVAHGASKRGTPATPGARRRDTFRRWLRLGPES